MAISLKISNVHENGLELIKRLRGVNSPGKKILLQALKDNDWKSVYKELLWRIELYTSLKVLNYTRKDLVDIATNVRKAGLNTIVEAAYEKFITPLLVNDETALVDQILQLNESKKDDYVEFFKEKLKSFGANSPADLSKEDKEKFFAEIKAEWD